MATVTRVRLRFLLANGRRARPGFWIGEATGDDSYPDADLQAIADDTRAALVSSSFMAGYDDTVIFEEAEAQNFQRFQVSAGPPAVFGWQATTITFESSGADVPGTQTADSAPPQISPIYSWKSTTPGPEGRNRCYLPPIPDTEINALGTIEATRLAQLEADMNAIVDAAVAAGSFGGEFVVASAKDDQLRDVVTRVIKPTVGTQRRRRKAA